MLISAWGSHIEAKNLQRTSNALCGTVHESEPGSYQFCCVARTGAQKDIRPLGWCLTPAYLDYLNIELDAEHQTQPYVSPWIPGEIIQHFRIPLFKFQFPKIIGLHVGDPTVSEII